jgi:hypothetical protein
MGRLEGLKDIAYAHLVLLVKPVRKKRCRSGNRRDRVKTSKYLISDPLSQHFDSFVVWNASLLSNHALHFKGRLVAKQDYGIDRIGIQ